MDITEYKEEFLLEQVKFVNHIQSDWQPREFKQTVKFYKKIFSAQTFDQELNLYLFVNNKIEGILNTFLSKNKEFITINIYIQELELSKLLFQELLHRIQPRGINSIQMMASSTRGNTLQIANSLGFTSGEAIFKYAKKSVNSLVISKSNQTLHDYNPDTDFDELIRIFVNKYGYAVDQITHETAEMFELKSLILNWKVIRIDGSIVAFSLLVIDEPGDTDALIRDIYVDTKRADHKLIFNALIGSHYEHSEKIDTMSVRLFPPQFIFTELFEKFGFNFTPVRKYIKMLDST